MKREEIGERDAISRRTFVEVLGAGILISAAAPSSLEGAEGRRGRGERAGDAGGGRGGTIAARLHIGKDGAVTVMTGKVELGQGSRAEISQAAAEELRVPVERVALVQGDTELCPDDGPTAGSRTTPSTIPAVRNACAAAREALLDLAARRWGVAVPSPLGPPEGMRGRVSVRDGVVSEGAGSGAAGRTVSYADLAAAPEAAEAFGRSVPGNVALTPVSEWKVLGTSLPRPNIRDLVTGAHRFPSDIVRPGMLHGKVLRPPSFGAKLRSIDLSRAKAIEGAVVVRDGDFVGCAAPTTSRAADALEALEAAASWEPAPHPSSREVFDHLKARAREDLRPDREVAGAIEKASKKLSASYRTSYIQHAPMETRAAVAEWDGAFPPRSGASPPRSPQGDAGGDGDRVTIWTGSQSPFGVRSEVARALGMPQERVRVVIPDAGGGFGGKHTGEYAVEAARLARAAGRPVSLQWTRREEFTWAYYRPAAVIEVAAGLDEKGMLVGWDFIDVNAGGAGIGMPYRVAAVRTRSVGSDSPVRQGSYRTLAAPANNFARECFMDELAHAAGSDPLAFRLAHLEDARMKAVLTAAAERFGWAEASRPREPGLGAGLACGTEKGSYVAACAEVLVDRKTGKVEVRRVTQVFECGKILNPANLLSQVQGCIIMGLGGALTEEIEFEGGKVTTDSFHRYKVPRFRDVPPLDIHLLDRPDLPPAGGGETPNIAIAPALGNAIFAATGVRLRKLPLKSA